MFSPHLYESVARSVVGDGEAESVFRFINFYLLLDPFNVGKDKILEADLAPQQLVHVNLVGVQGAEEDLCKDMQQAYVLQLINMYKNKQMQRKNTHI